MTSRPSIIFNKSHFVGRQFGELDDHYKVGEIIGKGGYGKVYKCVHKETGDERAVKSIEKEQSNDSQNSSIYDEIEYLKSFDHPNILRMYAFFEDDNFYYIVTDICEGGELFDEMYERGPFKESDAAELIHQILSCVNYCHDRNVVHRDLKPENILLEHSDRHDGFLDIKMIDFGLSHTLDREDKVRDTSVVGSTYYIAPEVYDDVYDSKCDLWSVGVIAYMLLSGYPPFDGLDDNEIEEKVLIGEFCFDEPIWNSVPVTAKDFIKDLLTYDPDQRPTAKRALQHAWMQNVRTTVFSSFTRRISAKEGAMSALSNMQKFHAQNKLKQAIYALLVSQQLPKGEKGRIDELFRALDLDCDGKLTKEEVQLGYLLLFEKNLSDFTVNDMFSRVDVDRNGYIEYSEFVMAAMNEKSLLCIERVLWAFDKFDRDGDGMISVEDMNTVLTFVGAVDESLDRIAFKKIVGKINDDLNDFITFDDFLDIMFRTADERPGESFGCHRADIAKEQHTIDASIYQ